MDTNKPGTNSIVLLKYTNDTISDALAVENMDDGFDAVLETAFQTWLQSDDSLDEIVDETLKNAGYRFTRIEPKEFYIPGT